MTEQQLSAFSAAEYDVKIQQTLPYYEEFYKQVIDTVNIGFTDAVSWLDVGCGTGKMAEMAFRHSNVGKFVFCDCAPEMLRVSSERFQCPETAFLLKPVQELEFQDNFDVVTAIQVNHYLQREERRKAINRCFQALKKNGFFITFENIAPFSKAGTRLYLERWKAYQQQQGKSLKECERHAARYNQSYFPISITEHLELLNNSGFRAVELLWFSGMQAGFLCIK